MDPVTALGVASGILSFLTFSTALLKVGHGVCVTSNGRNEQSMTREVVVDETKEFLDRLMPADDPRLADEAGLCRLVEESRRIAKDLMEILVKIKPKKSGTVANLRSAIRHTLSQPDMDDLEKRLDQCRSQLGLHLNSGYFNALKSSLDRIFEQGSLNTSQLSQLQTNVDRLRKGVVIESLSDEAQDQFRRLLGIQQDSVDRTCQQVILKALRFPDMRDRFDALDPAHKKTFRWILSDSEYREMTPMRKSARDKFLGWLSSGDKIFHICGKLGSGKSTLMKYLFEHKRTKAELEAWAGESNCLVSASFFFWKPGSRLQKSLPGLFRSLLHDILTARPEVIRSALPTIWERAMKQHLHPQSEMDISPQQIQTAFENLIRDKDLCSRHRFCFFIDGLDEYEQTTQHDYKSVVDMLNRWTVNSMGHVKLCVSSREDNVFMNAFDNQHRLRVHDLTLHDIRGYVADRLNHLSDEESKKTLVRDISNKASGIFFWVTLVVQSMREAIEDGISVVGLAELLDSLPPGLEDLFHHILASLDKKKLKKAFRTFAMLDRVKKASVGSSPYADNYPPLKLLAYSFLDHYERDKKFAIRHNFLDTIEKEMGLAERSSFAAKQLRANCGGLLEVTLDVGRGTGVLSSNFDYTHRSVPEYLEEIRSGERAGFSLSDQDFDAGDAVSSLILAQFRALESVHGYLRYEVSYAGLAVLRLSAVATPDQEPYEFLECLDFLCIKAKLHDTEHFGQIGLNLGHGRSWSVERRAFPGDRAITSTRMEPGVFPICLDRPIFVAMRYESHEYVAWKLLRDPGTFDTPAKRMALAYFARDSRLWATLFASGALCSREKSGFLMDSGLHSDGGGGWDTSRCAWFSAWRQMLIDEALDLITHTAILEQTEGLEEPFDDFGEALEQFLRRGAAGSDSDLELVITPAVITSTEDKTELRIENLTFRFGDGSVISFTNPSGGMTGIEIMAGGEADLNVLQWHSKISGSDIAPGKEMHMTFRQLIQAMKLPNQDMVFSLLDSRDALDIAATAGEVCLPETPEEAASGLPLPLLAEQDLSTTTAGKFRERNQSLWDRLDTDLALAFGSGVLVSLLVASVWMRYSGTRGQV